MSEYLTSTQIAAMARRSERTIARWRKRPDFPQPIQLPCAGRVLFDPAEVAVFLERREQAAA